MTKHTPGPWTYESDSDYHNGPNGSYVEISSGAPVDSPSRYASIDKGPTAKADAALIAAAPDLLAALRTLVSAAKEARGHWSNDRDAKVGKFLTAMSGDLPGYRADIDAAHAAIRKATGE